MTTLLIWDSVPEESDMYVLTDVPDWLVKVNGKYIGAGRGPLEPDEEQEALLQRVSDALSRKLDHCHNANDELACKWGSAKVDPESGVLNLEGKIQVIRCGAFL